MTPFLFLLFGLHSLVFASEFQFTHDEQIQVYVSRPDTQPVETLFSEDGVLRPTSQGPYFLTAFWDVEDIGGLWLEADNGGEFYNHSPEKYLLNEEFARSRILRNQRVMLRYQEQGLQIPQSVKEKQSNGEILLSLSHKTKEVEERAGLSDLALKEAILAGNELELAFARHSQFLPGFKRPIFGVDSRHYLWAKAPAVDEWVPKLFEYGTITHYISDTWFPAFEPKEGDLRWGTKIELYDWLTSHGMEVEARPILWPHEWVTPEWLKNKNFEELKDYVRNHATSMVKFWNGRIKYWEVANEMHDWANVHGLTAAQITELIKLACDTVRKLQPEAVLIINNTMPFGEYAGLRWGGPSPEAVIRTPYVFLRDLIEAGVDFDVIGLQIYHPERDLSDLVRLMERFESLGKTIVISEVSAPGFTTDEEEGSWRGSAWSSETQANWAGDIYRVLGTRESVAGIFWYDITDFRPFVPGGGVLTEEGEPKDVFFRLMELKSEWEKASGGKRKEIANQKKEEK